MNNFYRIPVIYYHSVGPKDTNWCKSFLTLKPSIFESQLVYISKNFKVITLKEQWQIQNRYIPPVKNPLVITFDDGYLDNWIYAFPLLKKYGLKATIFISPEFVDQKNGLRSASDGLGFLSWDEMRSMEDSGVIDIQSHTMTHTKYFVSEKLKEFHNPKADYLYPIGNLFPSEKPYYIGNSNFEKLIPYGYPFFEEESSVVARKVEINPDFNHDCVELLKEYDFTRYSFSEAFRIISPLYDKYVKKENLIINHESEEEYRNRLWYEINESKRIIENKLNKRVEFLCWPHGDNSHLCHKMAIDAGYLMTTTGKAKNIKPNDVTRISERMGADFSSFTKKLKTIAKLKALSGKVPYWQIMNISRKLKIKIII